MKESFTHLQLTRLVFGETTQAESDMLLELALTVPEIGESLSVLQDAKDCLEGDCYVPAQSSLDRIMAYSMATSPIAAR